MRRLAFVLACLVGVVPGCGGGDDAGDQPAGLEDGRHFGYIRAADAEASPPLIRFDVAQWFSLPEAQQAAEEDGAVAPGEAVSNDYYVRNPANDVEELPVADDVTVTHIHCNGGCRDKLPGDFARFAASFERTDAGLGDEYRGAKSQYWVTVRAGTVVAIDEQYVP